MGKTSGALIMADQTLAFIDKTAAKKNWALNADRPFVVRIAAGLAKNRERNGYYGCPCRDGDGDREADKDIICPCVYAQPDIDEHGHCFCGLFLSRDFAESGRKPASIPERRPEQ
jgi:ferredoxin-thioredoxin reductase catalytic chain